MAEYHRRYPEIVVDLSFEDRPVDLVEEGYDLAIQTFTILQHCINSPRIVWLI